MAKRKPKTLADVLRKACADSGLTAYRIGIDAGIAPEVVSRFLNGTDVRISTAGKIADVLNFELKPKGDSE